MLKGVSSGIAPVPPYNKIAIDGIKKKKKKEGRIGRPLVRFGARALRAESTRIDNNDESYSCNPSQGPVLFSPLSVVSFFLSDALFSQLSNSITNSSLRRTGPLHPVSVLSLVIPPPWPRSIGTGTLSRRYVPIPTPKTHIIQKTNTN